MLNEDTIGKEATIAYIEGSIHRKQTLLSSLRLDHIPALPQSSTYESVTQGQNEDHERLNHLFREDVLPEEIAIRNKLLVFNQKYHAARWSKLKKQDTGKWKRMKTALVSLLSGVLCNQRADKHC